MEGSCPLATTPQTLFSWQEVEASSDIARLRRLLEGLDDEALMAALRADRKGRRNEHPVECMWNAMLAGLVFQHSSIASLIRELRRNGELRQACGFDPVLGEGAVPSKHAFSRFWLKLDRHIDLVLAVFQQQVERLRELLPDFGQRLAVDGKAIPAWRKGDAEADLGVKTVDASEENGKTMSWFGYKLHLLADAQYELPIAFEVTAASQADSPHLLPLVEQAAARHPALIDGAETLAADRGYDAGPIKAALFEEHGIAPLIPARDCWKGQHQPLNPERSDALYVSPTGEVCCKIRPFESEPAKAYAAMQFQGFEADRQTLKFRCPAAAYGLTCQNQSACHGAACASDFGRVVRVPLRQDPRLFGPIYAHSHRFADFYSQRTSIERFFYRLDHLYGFERHTARGLKRVRLRMALALIAIQATAIGWIEAGEQKRMRSMLQAA